MILPQIKSTDYIIIGKYMFYYSYLLLLNNDSIYFSLTSWSRICYFNTI